MLLSKYFCPLLKENPKEAAVISHKLMLRAGLIRQTASGIYTWLPLGLKVLNKITQVIKREMDKSQALNLLMPTIQTADIWQLSGRYDDYGKEMLRIKDRHNKEILYSPTNEEQITVIFKNNVHSYKNLPLNLYQIQWKFRDEIRPRYGVMRGREFLMKDAYSFDLTQEEAEISYKKMFVTYLRIFSALGLQAIPMKADTGPIGGDLSHEFLILAPTGESKVYCDKNILSLNLDYSNINDIESLNDIYNNYTNYYAATEEKHNDNDETYLRNKENIINTHAIEVGHTFYFGTKYSRTLVAKLLNSKHEEVYLHMGSYGIGVSRLVGAMIEANHDDKGIIWHKNVAPFQVIINGLSNNTEITTCCNNIYNYLLENKIDVLYNDEDTSPGVKLATANLLGIPYQINIGSKSFKENTLELVERSTNNTTLLPLSSLNKLLAIIKG